MGVTKSSLLDQIKQGLNESAKDYRIRLYKNKDLYNLTNQEIGELCNEAFHCNYDESAHRKKIQNYLEGYSDAMKEITRDVLPETVDEIARLKRELAQEKVKLRDERNAWNKQNVVAARVEQKLDYFQEVFENLSQERYIVAEDNEERFLVESNNDLIVCLSDLHIGETFSNGFGVYNSDVAKDRLKSYLDEIIKIQARHNSENVYVVCVGDLISGNIHKQIAITNRENVIEQIKLASTYISDFCYELTNRFSNVYFVSASGNHSRIDRKDEALHDERLDDLISFIIETALGHIKNFKVLKDNYDTSLACFSVRGQLFYACHGDYDNFSKQGISDLVMFTKQFPYCVISGHKHFPAFANEAGVLRIQSGSLCGSGDDYTIEKRLTGQPSQTVCVCNKDGVQCVYPIILT